MEYKKEKYYKSNLHCQFWDLLWWFLLCNAKSLIVPGREKPWEQRSALGWSFHTGHGGRALEQFSTEGYLKTPRNWGFLLENNPNPPAGGWTWVSAPLRQQKKGSSCIILGLPGGFVNSLLAPRLVLVALRLEHRFLALVFGDYCLQFPSDRCLKEQYWAGEGGGRKKSVAWLFVCSCVSYKAFRETKEEATWNSSWGGTNRNKSSKHGPGKRRESREVGSIPVLCFPTALRQFYLQHLPHLSGDEHIDNVRYMICLKNVTPNCAVGWNEVHFPAVG